MPYCLHSEYSDMKALREHKRQVDDSLVEIGKTVRVWVRCPLDSQVVPQ